MRKQAVSQESLLVIKRSFRWAKN